MPATDPRIDAYIERSAEFAKPILVHIRQLVHQALPEVTETMKWSFPHFDYKGMLCSMASFKQHCTFGFWKQQLLENDAFPAQKTAMGSFGRITSIGDLPEDKVVIDLVRQAAKLNDEGVKIAAKPKAGKKELVVPEVLTAALRNNAKAKKTFDAFTYSKQKDYVEWLDEAKTEATREKRLAATIAQLEEGKPRHWKYQK